MTSVRSERVVVIGAGLVGLAVARELVALGCAVTVLEKESRVAEHQSSHNSGVVHAGLYYTPGSLRARLCREGSVLLRGYCEAKGIAFDEVGKLVVATTVDQEARLDEIERRARLNGVPGLERLRSSDIKEFEPNAVGVAALRSPHTAIVDYKSVAVSLCADIVAGGGEVLLGKRVTRLAQSGTQAVVTCGAEDFTADRVVICAGLQTDSVASLLGLPGDVRIVPFRGVYWQLTPSARPLVRGLIYPVPDPRYPFLGIHFTRVVGGQVLVGPNAVLALAMEGYRRGVSLPDVMKLARWQGFWRMSVSNWRAGLREAMGVSSRTHFTRQAQKLIPCLEERELEPAWSGVRAQAVDRSGALVDDFVIDSSRQFTLVRNAPSPAATSCLAIGKHIAEHLLTQSSKERL
ncbi:MAG: (S)-2-hydroxyglutarate dehydrogenase [Frankiales bacterium]|nr:(S)-2-hydroxyglutarate dehydrogenase [Frankiales bacterium]MDX6242635.1 (S)-2-hydroxyglutarate dehydrogenase [Frankiales bacterium]